MPAAVRVLVLSRPDGTHSALADRAQALVEQAGLQLVDLRTVEAHGLGQALVGLAARWGLVLVVGGADVPEGRVLRTLREQVEQPWPGLGEALRRAWGESHGPEAVLVDAVGGPMGQGLLVGLPGRAEPCLRTLQQVVLPLLPSLMPEDEEPTFRGSRVQLAQVPAASAAPAPAEPEAEGVAGGGWAAGLAALDATLSRGPAPMPPDALATLAPARNVLEQAGERGTVTLPDGHTLAAYGYPDLLRAGSKVLLVGPGAPWGEVLALHRHPRTAGLPARSSTLLPRAGSDPRPQAEERTGAPLPSALAQGDLFAVDGGTVYVELDGKVHSWDGRRARAEGGPKQVIASLLLRWSQR